MIQRKINGTSQDGLDLDCIASSEGLYKEVEKDDSLSLKFPDESSCLKEETPECQEPKNIKTDHNLFHLRMIPQTRHAQESSQIRIDVKGTRHTPNNCGQDEKDPEETLSEPLVPEVEPVEAKSGNSVFLCARTLQK
jgi:hypothetical protein